MGRKPREWHPESRLEKMYHEGWDVADGGIRWDLRTGNPECWC